MLKVSKNIAVDGKPVRYWLNIGKRYSSQQALIQAVTEAQISNMIDEGCRQGELHIPLQHATVSGYWLFRKETDALMTEFILHAVSIVLGEAERQLKQGLSLSDVNASAVALDLLDDFQEKTY